MAAELTRAGYLCCWSDVFDYGYSATRLHDFLRDDPAWLPFAPRAVVTNPPFDLGREFIRRALEVTRPAAGKVAILQRHDFDAPKTNWPLFEPPFAEKLILPRRPSWPIWNEETRRAEVPVGKDGKRIGPRFPYAWYVWDWRREGPPITRWIKEPLKNQQYDLREPA